MKKLICKIIGHSPNGVFDNIWRRGKNFYICNRCKNAIMRTDEDAAARGGVIVTAKEWDKLTK